MKIIDRLYEECTQPVEQWGGDIKPSLQCGCDYGQYVIYQWDCVKQCYDEWINCPTAVDMLLRYFRAKCFEGELLDCDRIQEQLHTLYHKLNDGEMHC